MSSMTRRVGVKSGCDDKALFPPQSALNATFILSRFCPCLGHGGPNIVHPLVSTTMSGNPGLAESQLLELLEQLKVR